MTTTISSALPSHTYSPREFEHESRRIDALTFDTLALTAGESVVFCGFTGNIGYVRRAIEIGCKVAVIEARESVIREHANLGVRTIRGSTSVIPARDLAFDVAIAVGYLHEVDPSFHAQILTELARVAKRVALIELAPPTDPLGRRIAALYSR
ncbi:MAG: class I SAM-dependent methyltransferase, partial [Vulcanimicrobiaceae bacterium]